MMKLSLPWNNLGCLGLTLGVNYADVFRNPYLGTFWRTRRHAGYVNWLKLRFRLTECHCGKHRAQG